MGWVRDLLARTSFRQQLALAFSVGIALLALASSLVIANLSSRTMQSGIVDTGLQVTESLARQSGLALLYRSPENSRESMAATLGFPDVLGVAVFTVDHELLFEQGQPTLPSGVVGLWPDSTRMESESDTSWYFVAPVYAGADDDARDSPFAAEPALPDLLGFVRVVMGKETLANMSRDVLRVNLVVSVSLAVLILAVLLAITRRVTTPLRNLANTMQRAEEGETNLRAEVRGPRDIVHMEVAFNTMMEVLEAREQELRGARDLAMESARSKGEFAANVSHELRTPLNGVLGMLELLQGTGLTPRQREYVGVACGSGEALLSLIDDILDFSKNDAGRLEIETTDFDLQNMLDEIVGLLAGQAQRKDVDLAYVMTEDVPHELVGDSGRIRQVLINLIGNAIKFTDQGEVEVSVCRVQGTQELLSLRFQVRDTGIGIAEEALARVFEPFSQADGSTTRRFGGTGLGLAICKQLVTLMGGDMSLESEAGKGSCFSFVVPLKKSADLLSSPTPGQDDLVGLRVLAVDDSPASVAFLRQTFASWSCSFSSALEPTEGLAMAEAAATRGRPFDIMLVDEALPGMASDIMIRKFAATDGGLVLMTNQWGSVRAEEPHAGVAGSLSKPIRKGALQQCIESVMRRHGSAGPDPDHNEQQPRLYFPGSRILVVEDNRANQQVALGMLERLGCQVEIVGDGVEAVEAVSRQHWDLVLMDCQMPQMDGFDATRQIRKLEGGRSRVPIVAMTANAQKGDSERCLASGMDDYLAKPLRIATLRERLVSWLAGSGVDGQPRDIDVVQTDAPAGQGSLDPGVLAELRETLGSAYAKMVGFYLEDTPGHIQAIEAAVGEGDADRLHAIAHSIKGSSRNLGAERLADICKQLEDIGRSGVVSGADSILVSLKREYDQVKDGLADELPTAAGGTTSGDGTDARVLVVDDDRSMRVALHNILEQDGYRIQEASNGEMAVSICERHLPDLVLMDALMPKLDGFAACRRIRSLPGGNQVPILIVTGLDDDDSIERAFGAGATDYIPKPVHFGVLRQRVGRLLEAARAEKHVHHLAYHDPLTGLPNRAMCTERLGEMIARSRPQGERLSVLFLDLDRFKLVNDTLGHDVGDLLLKAVADRIKGGVRSCDLVARLGGDEFIVILDGVKTLDVVGSIADKITTVLSAPFVFMGQEMYVTTSIGISVYPDHGDDIGTLMKRADTAMFRAKETGARHQFYEQGMEAAMSQRLLMESELRRALERDELVLHYQPQADLHSGRIVGAEALVRWQHPVRGLLPPSEFIGIAEETGLIVPLGEWVLRNACLQLRSWIDKGYESLKMAVNLSSRQLGEAELAAVVGGILEEAGVPAERLELEITESTIMNRAEDGVVVLRQLKELGVQLSIDDFGTGYSSLSSLKRFPVDMLKIDRSFVRDSDSDPDDAAIIGGIVALARSLRLVTVAEGVETADQYLFLQDLQCDLMQGYFLSEPLPAGVFEQRMLESSPELPVANKKVTRIRDHRLTRR